MLGEKVGWKNIMNELELYFLKTFYLKISVKTLCEELVEIEGRCSHWSPQSNEDTATVAIPVWQSSPEWNSKLFLR